jgi:hypothetical protein
MAALILWTRDQSRPVALTVDYRNAVTLTTLSIGGSVAQFCANRAAAHHREHVVTTKASMPGGEVRGFYLRRSRDALTTPIHIGTLAV